MLTASEAPTATVSDIGAYVYQLLYTQSQVSATRWEEGFLQCHPAWRHGPLPSQQYQMQEINWYLRVNLGMLEIDTAAHRAALIDNISFEYWRQNFEFFIQPLCVVHQLPILAWSQINS